MLIVSIMSKSANWEIVRTEHILRWIPENEERLQLDQHWRERVGTQCL
jgi:hypothetical protein